MELAVVKHGNGGRAGMKRWWSDIESPVVEHRNVGGAGPKRTYPNIEKVDPQGNDATYPNHNFSVVPS